MGSRDVGRELVMHHMCSAAELGIRLGIGFGGEDGGQDRMVKIFSCLTCFPGPVLLVCFQ